MWQMNKVFMINLPLWRPALPRPALGLAISLGASVTPGSGGARIALAQSWHRKPSAGRVPAARLRCLGAVTFACLWADAMGGP